MFLYRRISRDAKDLRLDAKKAAGLARRP